MLRQNPMLANRIHLWVFMSSPSSQIETLGNVATAATLAQPALRGRCMARPRAVLLGLFQCRKEASSWQNTPYRSYGQFPGCVEGRSHDGPRAAALADEQLGIWDQAVGPLGGGRSGPADCRAGAWRPGPGLVDRTLSAET